MNTQPSLDIAREKNGSAVIAHDLSMSVKRVQRPLFPSMRFQKRFDPRNPECTCEAISDLNDRDGVEKHLALRNVIQISDLTLFFDCQGDRTLWLRTYGCAILLDIHRIF